MEKRMNFIWAVFFLTIFLLVVVGCNQPKSSDDNDDTAAEKVSGEATALEASSITGSIAANDTIELRVIFSEAVDSVYVAIQIDGTEYTQFQRTPTQLNESTSHFAYKISTGVSYERTKSYKFAVQARTATGLSESTTFADENAVVAFTPQNIGKFTPPVGDTLLIIGQDIDTVNAYSKEMSTSIVGTTSYMSGDGTGVFSRFNDIKGPLDLQSYLAGYQEQVLTVGLWMVGQEEAIAARDTVALANFHNVLNELKAADRPVFLRLGYEVEGPWNSYAPDAFVNMWRYTHDWIEQNGAKNIALVWQLASYCATSFDGPVDETLGTGGNSYHQKTYESWWPGDQYVDWTALSYFTQDRDCPGVDTSLGGLPTEFGKLSDVDSDGNSKALDNVMDYLISKGKPIMIAESSPKGYHLAELKYMSGVESDASALIDVTIEQIWNNWYRPYFDFIDKYQANLRASVYINTNWNALSGWDCIPGEPKVPGANCGDGYWGDNRVQANSYIKDNFIAELAKPLYQSEPYSNGFSALNGWDEVTLVNRSQVAYSVAHAPHAIPGLIQAEDFDLGGEGVSYHETDASNTGAASGCRTNENVDTGSSDSVSCFVNDTVAGEWMEYTVDVAGGGDEGTDPIEYIVNVSLARSEAGGVVNMTLDGDPLWMDIAVTNTGSMTRFELATTNAVSIAPGQHVIRVEMAQGTGTLSTPGNIDYIEFVDPTASFAYKTTHAAPIPGRIQIEEFNRGPQGAAYSDKSTGANTAIVAECSRDDVAEAAKGAYPVRIAQHYGLCAVMGTTAGEWMEYTVQVAETATYDLRMRAIHGDNAAGGAKFSISIDGTDVSGNVATPVTDANWNWETTTDGNADVIISNLALVAGEHKVRVIMQADHGGHTGLFDYMEFTRTTAADDTDQTAYQINTISATGETVLDGGLFDNGGEGIAWADTSEVWHQGTNSACRTETGVDPATDVNWNDATIDGAGNCALVGFFGGEWVEYTIDVQETKTYSVSLVNASGTPGTFVILDIAGKNILFQPLVSTSGGWNVSDVTTETVQGVTLEAGTHVVRLTVALGGLNVYQLKFTP